MLPVEALVSCSPMFSFLFYYTSKKCFKLSMAGISLSREICIPFLT